MADQDATKRRLLDAAGEEFAAKGYEAARVRSICRKAEANVASVNYYFGDKGQLYTQAVLEAHRCGMRSEPDEALFGPEVAPEAQLREFVRHFLSNVLAMSRDDTWHHALMLREMLRPSAACEAVVREAIRPRFERLLGILGRFCPDAEPRRLNALAFSVIGQCLFYKTARPVTERLVGPEMLATLDLDFLTDHITTFSLSALGLPRAAEVPGAGRWPTS